MRRSTWLLFFLVLLLAIVIYEPYEPGSTQSPESNTEGTIALSGNNETPLVVWYVVAKRLGPDFMEKASAFRPDILLLTVYAEDDIAPYPLVNRSFDLAGLVDGLHGLGVKVFFSFSLFSRSSLPREEYDRLLYEEGIPYPEQTIHMADYARHLRETNETLYHETYDIYLENGLDPEKIPHVERKPVDGYLIPPGQYTSIDPLYQPYHEFMVRMMEQIIAIAEPDGLAFDHVRFFTFDDGYNQDCRDWMFNASGLDIYEHTPRPMFHITEWSGDDALYYDTRAQLISHAVSDIIDRPQFDGYEKFGTSMGMTEPARSNGQYAELQGQLYDAVLLMAYDDDSNEVARNVRETNEASGADIILGVPGFIGEEAVMRNIDAGLAAGARGIYLLGYTFSDDVHDYLLELRGA